MMTVLRPHPSEGEEKTSSAVLVGSMSFGIPDVYIIGKSLITLKFPHVRD